MTSLRTSRQILSRPQALLASVAILVVAILAVSFPPAGHGGQLPAAHPPSATPRQVGPALRTFGIGFFDFYNVSFVESGLTAGLSWSVIFDGATFNNSTTAGGGEISASVLNGTYGSEVFPPSIFWGVAAPSSVTVHGSDVTVPVTFSSLSAVSLTLHEAGLPKGSTWGVRSVEPGVSTSGSSATLSFSAPSERPTALAIVPPAYYGLSSAKGPGVLPSDTNNVVLLNLTQAATVDLLFRPLATVTFDISGLPDGVTWTVSLAGTGSADWHVESGAVATTTYSATVPSSRYSFVVASSNDSFASVPGHGFVQVPSHNVTKSIVFHEVTAKVRFHEIGLPKGVTWTIWITGPQNETWTGDARSATFNLPSGTYSFDLPATPLGYNPPIPSSGTFQVEAPTPFSVYVVYNPAT
jgi:hypothetical protein